MRRVASVVALAVAMTALSPVVGAPGTSSSFSLWDWLGGLLVSPAQAATPPSPKQRSGTAKGAATHVAASATDAGRGAGRAPGKGKGELPQYQPFGAVGKRTPARSGRVFGDGRHSFDPRTSKRVAAASNETQDVYANADGSYTRRVHQGRVNFKAADGSWTPIDTDLVRRANGRFAVAANDVRVEVAASAADPALITVVSDDRHGVTFALQGAAPVAGVVKGGTATYPGVFPGVDLVESAVAYGVKGSLVLHSADAGNSWLFPLRLKGLTPRLAAEGDVQFVDATGAVRQTIPHGFMEDSKVDPRSGERAFSREVTYALATGADGAPALRVSVDRGWLADPARVFPVTVDPTSMMGTSSTTYVETLVPGPHNSETGIKIGTWDGGSHKARSFLGLTGFENSYAGQRMTSVTLSVFDSWATNCTSTTSFSVGQVTEPWSSSGLVNYPGSAIGGSTTSPVAIGSWSGVAPSVACNNTSANRNVGAYLTTGPLNVATFNDWIANKAANYGLALFTSETNSNYWKIFDSNVMSDYQPILNVTYTPDVAPVVDAIYPPKGFNAGSLTPQLLASGHDPDSFPSTVQYVYSVFTSAGTLIVQSGPTGGSWNVPAGKLAWGQTYLWTAQPYDGYAYGAVSPASSLSTPVPQPLVTSGLAQNADGHGFDPGIGNYTTSATDADVATVGPDLSVQRDYNSRDRRTGGAFGAGWSSVFDMSVDVSGPVTAVITYPSGEQIAFGKNANGTFSPPLGRFATFAAVSGGYTLTDKNGTVYAFKQALSTGVYGITSVADAAGRTEVFTYTDNQITQVTSASGRHLNLTWATPTGATHAHVASVSTDPATAGDPDTVSRWTYSYSGDRLVSVCPPTSSTACSAYTYSDVSQYPTTVLDSGPGSYWRLNESAGSTVARSGVLANEGVDNGTFTNVGLGTAAGPLAGSTSTAAVFDGSSSVLQLTKNLVTNSSYLTLSLWFRTTSPGLLFVEQNQLKGTTPSHATPSLYVGTDNKLHGAWFTGSYAQLVTSTTVTDGQWHQAVLTGAGNTQTLYLDGAAVGTLAGTINNLDQQYAFVGSGYSSAVWPQQPAAGWNTFDGAVAEVAVYPEALTSRVVADLHTAALHPAAGLTSVVRPSGSTYAAVAYDTVSGSVTQVTDEDGAVWELGAPTVGGSSQTYVSSVLGSAPREYWRLGDTGGAVAANQVNGNDAYFNNVTLGSKESPFGSTDGTAASFNGSSSFLQAPAGDFSNTGPMSVELWFNTTSHGVLVSEQATAMADPPAGTRITPLYVGTDGYLYGGFWTTSQPAMKSAAAVNDGKWHHVVLTGSGTSQALYLDGATVKTVTTASGMSLNGQPYVYVGAGSTGSGWPALPGLTKVYFNGHLGDVSLYDKVLPATEVTAHYQAARSATARPIPATTVTVIDPADKTLTYVSDTLNGNRPLSETDALGNVTAFGYDTSGFLHTVTDPNGNVTTTGHDVRGNTVSQVTCQDRSTNRCSTAYYTYYPDATSTTLSPDPRNDLLLTVRDARSVSATDDTYLTSYTYDAKGNRTAVTTPAVLTDGAATAATRTESTVYSDGTTTASVDGGLVPAGLPVRQTSPGGAVTAFAYYANGDLAQVSDPVGLVTRYTYDGLGQELTETVVSDTYPDGLTTTSTYDKAGRVVTETSPAVTDRVSGAVHTARVTTSFDVDGNVTSQTVADTTGGDASRTQSTVYDASGRPASSTDAAGGVTTFGYDVYGNVAEQVDPGGTRTRYGHDAQGRLLTTTLVGYTGDPLNPSPATDLVESSRAYDPAGRLASITDAMGRVTAYAYTDDGLLAKVTRRDVAPSTATFVVQDNTYDAAGNLVSQRTNNGATVTATVVDAAGRATSSTVDPGGLDRRAGYSYTADDDVATTRLSDGSAGWSTVSATYDAAGRVVSQSTTGSVAPARTLTAHWSLDRRGLPRSETDPAGNVTDFTYDEAGQLVLRVEPAVDTETGGGTPTSTRPITTTGYNTFGEIAEVSDQNGNVTTYGYDAEGRATSMTLPSYTPPGAGSAITATVTQAYNSVGQPTSQTDALGNQTTFAYDQLGALAAVTDPNGGVTHTTYDAAGEPLSVTDAAGAVSQATYDYLGRRVTSTQQVRQPTPANHTTTCAYAGVGGWLESVTSPAGVVTSSSYNAVGEPVRVVDGAGQATTYGYDFAGRRVSTRLPDATSRAVSYDDAGNVVGTADKDAAGAVLRSTSSVYDVAGNLASSTDARGNTSTFTYDATGAVTGQVEPVGAGSSITSSFGYDAAGHRTRFTDGRGSAWLTTYNPWGLPESEIEPPTTTYPNLVDRTFTAVYDGNGRVRQATAPGGVSVTHTYDGVGNLTGSSGSGGEVATTARSFGYDAVGRLTSVSAPGGTDTFGYDDRGLLLNAAGPSGASSFAWTADGRMASRVDAAGTTSYTYDGAGRLASLADPVTAATATYSYNSVSLPTRVSYGEGKNTRSYGYDGLHRLTSDTIATSAGATVASIVYGYDANDNVTSKTTTGVAGASANSYTYDAADRLTSWDNGSTTVAYAYDGAGNLTRAGSTTYTYNPKNQLISDGTRSYVYSKRGTLYQVKQGATVVATSKFDAFGQAVVQGSRTYAYDGLGRVVTASGDAAGTATMAYSGLGNTLAADGFATYSRDPGDGLFGVGSAGQNVVAWTDEHDDVVGQFSAAGTVLSGSVTYDPFGAVTATSGMVGYLGYQSGWTDPSTARVNMGSRWYDPGMDRFVSRDKVALDPVPDSVAANRYAYVDDNPLGAVDPLGTWPSWGGLESVGKALTGAVSTGVHYTAKVVSAGAQYTAKAVSAGKKAVVSGAKRVYHTGVKVTKKVVQQGIRVTRKTVHWVADGGRKLQKSTTKLLRAGKQFTTKQARRAVKAGKTTVRKAKTAAKTVARKTVSVSKATAKFVQHHAGAIASTVVSVAVFVGCEAALGALTLGAGAVAGAVACGALAGAVGGAVGHLADAAAGNSKFSWKGLAVSAGVGALAGAAGGALGGAGGAAASRLGGTAAGRMLGAAGNRLAGSAVGRGAAAAGRGMDAALAPARAAGTKLGNGARAMMRGGDDAVGADARVVAERAGGGSSWGRSCLTRHSFAPATRVVMADGTARPIGQVKLGDKVLATDAATGKTEAKPVVALHHNTDTDLTDLTVRIPAPRASLDKPAARVAAAATPAPMTGAAQARAPNTLAGATAAATGAATVTVTVHTTSHHPFWNQTHGGWTDAADLTPGDTLHTLGASNAVVAAVHTWTGAAAMNDLTVEATHTYYVFTADTPVLVHNCGEEEVQTALQDAFPERNVRTGLKISRADGTPLTDHDVYDDDFICEVACGLGKGKVAQMNERILPTANGKRVAVYAPNPRFKPTVTKGIEDLGVPVFRNMEDLIAWVGPKS